MFLDCTDRVRMAMSPRANAATLSRSCSGRAPDSSCAQLIPASVHIRERGRLERNALELCGCIRLCAADGGADHRLQGLDKGLWRGVGERHLRGLYNGPASSSIGHHQFREEASTRSARIFGPAVEHKRLTKRSIFFLLAQLAIALAAFSNNSRSAPRSGNAATLPTLQMESRHAASATPPAFWRRKHDHERQPARPCM